MKYNKTHKRFDIGLGLNFRIVEDNGKLKAFSNIPALDMKVLKYTEMHFALNEVLNDICYDIIKTDIENYKDARQFIKENNIKELL